MPPSVRGDGRTKPLPAGAHAAGALEDVAGRFGHGPADVVAVLAEIGDDVAAVVAEVLDGRADPDVQFDAVDRPRATSTSACGSWAKYSRQSAAMACRAALRQRSIAAPIIFPPQARQ